MSNIVHGAPFASRTYRSGENVRLRDFRGNAAESNSFWTDLVNLKETKKLIDITAWSWGGRRKARKKKNVEIETKMDGAGVVQYEGNALRNINKRV